MQLQRPVSRTVTGWWRVKDNFFLPLPTLLVRIDSYNVSMSTKISSKLLEKFVISSYNKTRMSSKNRYVSELDEKVFTLLTQYEKGEVSEKVLKIAVNLLFSQYYPGKLSRLISDQKMETASFGISVKSVVRYDNCTA